MVGLLFDFLGDGASLAPPGEVVVGGCGMPPPAAAASKAPPIVARLWSRRKVTATPLADAVLFKPSPPSFWLLFFRSSLTTKESLAASFSLSTRPWLTSSSIFCSFVRGSEPLLVN